MPRRFRVLADPCIGLTALSVLSWLAWNVWRGATLSFDAPVRAAVSGWVSAPTTFIMRMLTTLGAEFVLVPWGIWLAWRWAATGRAGMTLRFGVTFVGAELIVQIVKILTHRLRPPVLFGLLPAGTYSFPSGHAFVSTVFFGTLAALQAARAKSRCTRAGIWTGTALLLLAIGFSRVYLGHHFPSDVVGGWAAAIAWLITARRAGFSPYSPPAAPSSPSAQGKGPAVRP
jgi:undecaprenyl-diphosphatase